MSLKELLITEVLDRLKGMKYLPVNDKVLELILKQYFYEQGTDYLKIVDLKYKAGDKKDVAVVNINSSFLVYKNIDIFEYVIGKELNKLRRKIPTFVYTINTNLIEYIPNPSTSNNINKHFIDAQNKNILSVLFSLVMAFNKNFFVHGDLHRGNVIMRDVQGEMPITYKLSDDLKKTFTITHNSYIPVIIDFEFSSIVYKGIFICDKAESIYGDKKIVPFMDTFKFLTTVLVDGIIKNNDRVPDHLKWIVDFFMEKKVTYIYDGLLTSFGKDYSLPKNFYSTHDKVRKTHYDIEEKYHENIKELTPKNVLLWLRKNKQNIWRECVVEKDFHCNIPSKNFFRERLRRELYNFEDTYHTSRRLISPEIYLRYKYNFPNDNIKCGITYSYLYDMVNERNFISKNIKYVKYILRARNIISYFDPDNRFIKNAEYFQTLYNNYEKDIQEKKVESSSEMIKGLDGIYTHKRNILKKYYREKSLRGKLALTLLSKMKEEESIIYSILKDENYIEEVENLIEEIKHPTLGIYFQKNFLVSTKFDDYATEFSKVKKKYETVVFITPVNVYNQTTVDNIVLWCNKMLVENGTLILMCFEKIDKNAYCKYKYLLAPKGCISLDDVDDITLYEINTEKYNNVRVINL